MRDECRQYSDWLKDELAGELDPAHREELNRHLEACPHCRHERLELERAWGLLLEVRDEAVPRHFFVYDDLPAGSAGRALIGKLPFWWKFAFGSAGAVFCLGLVLLAAQARVEIGPHTIALSFGSNRPELSAPALRPEAAGGKEDLDAAIRSVVEEENRRWALELGKELEALIAQGSKADRESFDLALTALERRFEDRLGVQEERLQTSFGKVLGDSIDLVNGQRRSDIAQIRQVLGQFAAFNRYQAGQSNAIIETLTQIADNRGETRGGTR